MLEVRKNPIRVEDVEHFSIEHPLALVLEVVDRKG
jgi:hypothetical protein